MDRGESRNKRKGKIKENKKNPYKRGGKFRIREQKERGKED